MTPAPSILPPASQSQSANLSSSSRSLLQLLFASALPLVSRFASPYLTSLSLLQFASRSGSPSPSERRSP